MSCRSLLSSLRSLPLSAGLLAMGLALLLTACTSGSGSDIGPNLQSEPEEDWRLLVRDEQERPVVGARVTIAGFANAGSTNRSGRALLAGRPSGQRIVTVDGRAATAVPEDRLGVLAISATLPDQGELPYVVYLPDSSQSTGLTVPTGTAQGATTLDDTASSGATLTFPGGWSVEHGSANTVTLRTGHLSAQRLPPGLSTRQTPLLTGRGIHLEPVDAILSLGAVLSVQDDLGLIGGQSAVLYHLDPSSGTWSPVGVGEKSGASIVTLTGVVTRGGLYAFAVPAGATTTVTGRILNPSQSPVDDVLVRVGEVTGRTTGDGRFAVGPVATVDSSGGVRGLQITLHGGRHLRPKHVSLPVPDGQDTVDLGDLTVDFELVTNFKVLLVESGRADPFRTLRASSTRGGSFAIGTTDERGEVLLEDLEAGEAALLTTRQRQQGNLAIARYLNGIPARRNQARRVLFGSETDWWPRRSRGGSTQVQVQDRLATGGVLGAGIVNGQAPRNGYVGSTNEFGIVSAGFGVDGQCTAALRTVVDGRSVTAATSFVIVDSGRIEIPVERARWRPLSQFDGHGLFSGEVTGALGGTRTPRLQPSRRMSLEDWFDAILMDLPVASSTPRKLDPEVAGGTSYRIGVPLGVSHLCAVEGVVAGGILAPERLGLALDLRPVGGVEQTRNIALDLPADTHFRVPDAFAALDPDLDPDSLSYHLGLLRPDGTVVDVARNLGGVLRQGNDGIFSLPALTGPLSGSRWILSFGGRATAGSVTRHQRNVIQLTPTGAVSTPFVQVPRITAPAPNVQFDAEGFTVQFEFPESQLYAELVLRSDEGNDLREWRAILPGTATVFEYRLLPPDVAQPLLAGRNWTLTLTLFRIRTGFLNNQPDAYQMVLSNYVGIGPGERAVDGLASVTIPLRSR